MIQTIIVDGPLRRGQLTAKRVKEIGAPSLKHPFARVFTALRPFAAGELKGVQCGVFPPATENLGRL